MSVEEARYLLASTGGSGRRLSAFRGMRRRSLDMVVEEQPTDLVKGNSSVTSLVSQLGVPRHRNRSRSLDNSFETRNSFAAFKESLKVRLSDVTTMKSYFRSNIITIPKSHTKARTQLFVNFANCPN